jgi:hypothetical protein
MAQFVFKSLMICLSFALISFSGCSAQNTTEAEYYEYHGLDNADLSLIPVKMHGKCGYVNLKGEYEINLQFVDTVFPNL